ncbi:hypothetical protein [Laspinema palackyanum]|uniref:hypothetical protein n=1 Tax=Laspinema palackyanum TaxID=3231601 RepID=UPI003F68561A
MVYTIPLALRFSNDFGTLIERFIVQPHVLPMVPVQSRDGSEHPEGMNLLRQMVLARAFPHLTPEQRLEKMTVIFEDPQTLDRLCRVSGGHVRNVLRMLNDGIKKQRQLPLTSKTLEDVIALYRNARILAVTDAEWELLRRVRKEKKVVGDDGYQTLIRSMFVYEYRDGSESWFDVNPLLLEAKELLS